MDRFIHNENIRHYTRLLETETNEDKRAMLRKLLAEEQAKEIPGAFVQSDNSKRV